MRKLDRELTKQERNLRTKYKGAVRREMARRRLWLQYFIPGYREQIQNYVFRRMKGYLTEEDVQLLRSDTREQMMYDRAIIRKWRTVRWGK